MRDYNMGEQGLTQNEQPNYINPSNSNLCDLYRTWSWNASPHGPQSECFPSVTRGLAVLANLSS